MPSIDVDTGRVPEKQLKLQATIGFGGQVPNGFILHPNKKHTIYPVGSTVVLHHNGQQEFLRGHSNVITCLAVSKSGKYIASGQVTHMGFLADIIVWDFETRKMVYKLTLHKVKVEALAFSPNDKYLASLGGLDDNSVVVWDLSKGVAICGTNASKDSTGTVTCLTYSNNNDETFVTAGHQNLRIWQFNANEKKINFSDCQMGQVKRIIKCLMVDENDEYMYCGTTTGDLLQVSFQHRLFKLAGPPKPKDNFSLGIHSVCFSPKSDLLYIGCGDGTIAALKKSNLSISKKTKVDACVTSIHLDQSNQIAAATSTSNIYSLDTETFEPKRKLTCHYSRINDITFPEDCSDLFAAASDSDIRIWNLNTQAEVLRITLPNLSCQCVKFKRDGTSLITGWNDGKIRGFGPETGRLQFTIHDAHKGAVSALAVTGPISDHEYRIISGGDDGEVRVWRASKEKQVLEEALKEHKETVSCIRLRANEKECVSSSADGSCIIWDLTRFVRNQVLFAPTYIKGVLYFPEESQLLTIGTDRKVAYWEAFDGSLIREIEASQSDAINGLDITQDGKYFVMGGSDKVVKVYFYEEGEVHSVGVGHSTEITKISISPDQKHIVSVSSEGAIFIWAFPETVGPKLTPPRI